MVGADEHGTKELFQLRALVNGRACELLVDSGATNNFLSKQFASKNALETDMNAGQVVYADGRTTDQVAKLSKPVHLRVGGHSEQVQFTVADLQNGFDGILGMPWLMAHEPAMKWKKREMVIKFGQRRVCLKASTCGNLEVKKTTARIAHVTQRQMKRDLHTKGTQALLFVIRERKVCNEVSTIKGPVPADVACILNEFQDVLVRELPPGLPPVRATDHQVELLPGEHRPPYRPIYKMSPVEMEEARTQIEELLAKGRICPSRSPYGAPILFAKMKNRQLRMCIDYRALNDITKKNQFPIPRIDEMLEKLRGARYFSKLDLVLGYHQIRVAPADVEKTAFNTCYGHYKWLVMLFGMTNAPATFQTLMNEVFGDLLDRGVLVYLDDILIYANSCQQHLKLLKEVLMRLRKFKLYAQVAKCTFLQPTTEYLGHLILEEGIQMDPEKVRVVVEWPTPRGIRDVQSFIGLASYYRKFVIGFARITAPLTELFKSGRDWSWAEEQQNAFDMLKKAMSMAPVLAHPDPDQTFVVAADASYYAVGAVLQQDLGEGVQPIAYFSRKLKDAEVNYSVHERETLAQVLGLKHWRCYLEGPHFVVETDHSPLIYLQTQPSLSRRQARWLEFFQQFDFEVRYKKRFMNRVADALSRLHVAHVRTAVNIQSEWRNDFVIAYDADSEAREARKAIAQGDSTWSERDGPLWKGAKLYVPDLPHVRLTLIKEAHDLLCRHPIVTRALAPWQLL